ncbi:MAG: multicopper oxidase domain-containing protein [Acidobacteriia bacterium]|nr:multicopper oxidase domain-containing protein [Terriglobia bacterium]
MDRRQFLTATSAIALQAGAHALFPNLTEAMHTAAKPDFTLRIAPVSVELAPGKIVKTVGYNGTVPGPLLRMHEGVSTMVDVFNDTNVDELVHWHGLMLPAEVDGAAEEGTPPVPAHGQRRYTFVPKPAGTRLYHTHNAAGADLTKGMYSGQFGFLYIEPKSEPGNYDREVFLAIHQWEPSTAVHMGPPNNGLEISYQYASFNGKMLGHGEPIRVRTGERVLFRLLNASATDDLKIALPGHQFQVIALDGNPVLTPRAVNILQIGVTERIDAIVEMKQPGVWIFGATGDDERQKGMGVVIEYAGQKGEPQWIAPAKEPWDYGAFGKTQIPPDPDGKFELVFRKIPGERLRFNRWTINGKSFPDTDPLIVREGKRYRMVFRNESGDTHPLHLHRHTFEITNFAGKLMGGVHKDVVLVNPFSTAEIDFVANNPGLTLFHCHAQLHMDFGFMNLIKYA